MSSISLPVDVCQIVAPQDTDEITAQQYADRAFIAHAPEDIRDLLADAAAVRAERDAANASAREIASLTVSTFVDALRAVFAGIIPANTWTQTWPPEVPLAHVREVAEREFKRAETAEAALAASPRMFPVMLQGTSRAHPTLIPWSLADKAYSVYAGKFGRDQSLERLAARGGFHVEEMDEYVPDWREQADEITALRRQVAASQAQREGLEEDLRVAWRLHLFHPECLDCEQKRENAEDSSAMCLPHIDEYRALHERVRAAFSALPVVAAPPGGAGEGQG